MVVLKLRYGLEQRDWNVCNWYVSTSWTIYGWMKAWSSEIIGVQKHHYQQLINLSVKKNN